MFSLLMGGRFRGLYLLFLFCHSGMTFLHRPVIEHRLSFQINAYSSSLNSSLPQPPSRSVSERSTSTSSSIYDVESKNNVRSYKNSGSEGSLKISSSIGSNSYRENETNENRHRDKTFSNSRGKDKNTGPFRGKKQFSGPNVIFSNGFDSHKNSKGSKESVYDYRDRDKNKQPWKGMIDFILTFIFV
jgi:hypothetical protein